MKIFISWSGENSKKLAESLRNWIPTVLQLVKPYFSPSDIEKGTRWNTEIGKELESSKIGILCVTRNNLHSDWVMFEAGALSKSMDKSHVCPVLFGIHNTDLAGPLKQFQTTEFQKEDFRKLVGVINTRLGEHKLAAKTLDTVFNKWWPELETEVSRILAELSETSDEPIRTERDMLVEILELSRMATRLGRRPSIHPNAVENLLQQYITLHNENQSGHGSYQDTLDRLEKMKKSINYFARVARGKTPEIESLAQELETLTFVHEKEDKDEDEPESDNLPF